MTHRGLVLLAIQLILMSISMTAQSKVSGLLTVGIGGIFPSEQHPLNVPGEAPLPSSFALDASSRWPINETFFAGLRGFITINKLRDYSVFSPGQTTPRLVTYRLTTYSLGVDVLGYIVTSGDVRPYASAMLAFSGGTLADSSTASLRHQGYVVGVSVGVQLKLSKSLGLNLEALTTFGNSRWIEPPFTNSNGTQYDPSTSLILLSFSYLAGK